MHRTILLLFMFVLTVGVRGAELPDSIMEARADRAFEAGDWASAQALYAVLADKAPSVSVFYARATVAAELRGDTAVSTAMVHRALAAGVSFDDLFSTVEAAYCGCDDSSIYPRMLERMSGELPYLKRAMQLRLLNYYLFRADPQRTIEYAEALLTGIPDDTRFLNILAYAYLMDGKELEAVETYERVLEVDPDNYEALLTLGNYYLNSRKTEAVGYLRRAQVVKDTPYVRSLLDEYDKPE